MERKYYLLIVFIVSLALVVFSTKFEKRVPRRISFKNAKNISGMKVEEAEELINTFLEEPIYLSLESKSKSIKLKNLGVKLNKENLYNSAQKCLYKMLCWGGNKDITAQDLITIDQSDLEEQIQEINQDISFITSSNIISLYDFSFRAVSDNAKIEVDSNNIKSGYISEIIGSKPMILSLKVKINDDPLIQKTKTQELQQSVAAPILIKYGRNPTYISSDKIASFLEFREENGLSWISTKKDKIKEYIEELKALYPNNNISVLSDHSAEAIQRAIVLRAADQQINNAVILPQEGKPQTDGEKHDRYLEVNKSQQRLYRFEDGKLTKTYIVSTGLTWETPPGEYSVLGKQKMTISYFNDWYMPNYLPIGTINGYRFGFHSIPYHVDGAGNIFSRDPNTMGSPATGGCIQLTEVDSLELFNWADVGTPVYIFE